jgi:peptidoglycan L-alanyl-D-glutamate endopeptidase CwlK
MSILFFANGEIIMPYFGKESRKQLDTCHPDLIRLAEEVIKYVDFSVTCGHRGQAAQEKAFAEKATTVHFPNSKHNSTPSRAIDVAPYPIHWNDVESFTLLSGVFYGIAKMLKISIRIGADWDGDFNMLEHKFKDRPHIELL